MPPVSADAENPQASLTPRLEEILQSHPDRAFAGRLRKVYAAAAQAIGRLSDMDLVKYETPVVDSSPDLSLWEEMAPVIRDTVMDVNALLNVIREQFPAQPSAGLADILREVGGARFQDPATLLQDAMTQLAQGITQLGEAMRNPSVVSDRWTLLAEIQSFRARFREQVSNLVFETASTFGEVTRAQVVPGHEAEVKAAVTVRAITADLGRILTARHNKVREAEPEDVQWNAQQLQTEMDAFGRTAAYRNLRAQDKRHIVEMRAEVGRLAILPNPSRQDLLKVVSELDAFVRGLSAVNQRQVLIIHDREVWASCGVKLERALMLSDSDAPASARLLAEAAVSAQSLYGRASDMDAFLRKARKQPLAQLVGPELRATIEVFQGLLAQLDVM
ncbi:hypothetical protein HUA74_39250 [Myxococcus sp. CA051A]|uniref:Uncharacterized protein n=1 Tax=Myxococcus llanfairpwllgwyngyllgogerychwyrndrobwllllantysiliogogogochensis TaxID=2590453 RepID=A0A540X172_9BACT|nr:hypothetical protein [Myxococcus llanfairpwllgwyngyllgogerychwyrndrobwllllantysiliogogogochensis]NTX07900.1 hypothetical protein [Myxococcus sp. CA040A]NTX14869.1 hypothetical protein [Myxococcus sp. CA056]NTX40683.1 hypothetical protein [Myxococcus sp. CA033]NTX57407.1 hypothetical protein [Myxococcus sp. CA039A]NTX66703.1 hypothetical protein [Myxococcus sp. CA051A]